MNTSRNAIVFLLLIFCCSFNAQAEDMRALQIKVEQQRQLLEQNAAQQEQEARAEAERSHERIVSDKETLDKAIANLQQQLKSLQQSVNGLEQQNNKLKTEEQRLKAQLAESNSLVRETVGVIRANAKDLITIINENLQTAVVHPDTDFLTAITSQTHFPGMSDLRKMIDLLFEQLQLSAEVELNKGSIIDRSGRKTEAEILTISCFTAAYRIDQEIGFLNYSAAGQNLYALSRLPSRKQQAKLRTYFEGTGASVPVDVSRGVALQQLTQKLSLWQQIPRGGLLVWPILAILLFGVLIVIERMAFLWRKRLDGNRLISQIGSLAATQDWQECKEICQPYLSKPIARVLWAGLTSRYQSREETEDVLQEAILKEIPPLERFLATLGMLAAIAPLLGLLGTVTGMIDTFQVITAFGTGDPRMMSGGISVALVTTMLGLAVAIPIMLAHTLLTRAVDNHIGQLEEKAVALVNIMQKNR